MSNVQCLNIVNINLSFLVDLVDTLFTSPLNILTYFMRIQTSLVYDKFSCSPYKTGKSLKMSETKLVLYSHTLCKRVLKANDEVRKHSLGSRIIIYNFLIGFQHG